MLALAGGVAGRRFGDAGCGAGRLLGALHDRGALVTGIDRSAGMLVLARRRLGDDADLHVTELGSPLPFPDDTFVDFTASLVLTLPRGLVPGASPAAARARAMTTPHRVRQPSLLLQPALHRSQPP